MRPIQITLESREDSLKNKKVVVDSDTKDLVSSITSSSYHNAQKITMLQSVIEKCNDAIKKLNP